MHVASKGWGGGGLVKNLWMRLPLLPPLSSPPQLKKKRCYVPAIYPAIYKYNNGLVNESSR